MRLQCPVPVVITDGVSGAEVGYPSAFEQRNQPGLVLSRDGDRAGNRHRDRATGADGPIEDLINPTKVGASKRRQAVVDHIGQGVALVHSPHAHGATLICFGWHLPKCSVHPVATPQAMLQFQKD